MNIFDPVALWYKAGEADLAKAVFDLCEKLQGDQSELRENWKRYAQYYSNRREIGLDFSTDGHLDLNAARVPDNVVKSTIDTAASIIAKNQVKVRVLTNGACFTDQQNAKRAEKFVYGEMRYAKAFEIMPLIFRDSCVFGHGVLKVYVESGKLRLERVLISNILVDEANAINGNPRDIHERRLVDKDVLISLYPEYRNEIELAAGREAFANEQIPRNHVIVVESHRLPNPDGSGGRHTICIEKAVLLDEKYKRERFPYVFYRWDGMPLSGWYGLGLARLLQGYQDRIDELNDFIRKCQDLIAVPRVFVDFGSKLLKVQLNNQIGAIIPYRGKPPTFFTPQALTGEIYSYKDQLKRDALAEAGISQLSSQSLKPAGLESAVALREFSDIESNRFVVNAQRYERAFLDLGEHIIELGPDISVGHDYDDAPEPDWDELDLYENRFVLDIQAASLLSMTPAARLQAVTELAQVGQLDKAEIRYLLGHPDLERSASIAYADFNDIQRVEELLLEGEYESPEPFQNLELGIKRISLLYLKTRTEYPDVPEQILEGMRTWVSQAEELITMAQAPQPGAMPGGPVPPGAGAMPGAVEPPLAGGVAGSDVIQNLPGQITG